MCKRTQVNDDFWGKMGKLFKSTTFEPKLRPILPIGKIKVIFWFILLLFFSKKKCWKFDLVGVKRGLVWQQEGCLKFLRVPKEYVNNDDYKMSIIYMIKSPLGNIVQSRQNALCHVDRSYFLLLQNNTQQKSSKKQRVVHNWDFNLWHFLL